MLTCLVIILWFLLGLIGAKWCLDDTYNKFKRIDNSDVLFAVVLVGLGIIGFFVGTLAKYSIRIEKTFEPNLKITEIIQNYYKWKKL